MNDIANSFAVKWALVGLQGLHWGLFLDIEEDMDILQFKDELNFEFTDDNDDAILVLNLCDCSA